LLHRLAVFYRLRSLGPSGYGTFSIYPRLPEPNPAWRGDNPDPGTSYAPYKLYNIGNNNPVELLEFIKEIENALGRQAQKEFLDLQPGDVPATYADVDDLMQDVGFKPETSIATGIRHQEYYSGIKSS
jgi:UDP-glucuronate 4-epimerase